MVTTCSLICSGSVWYSAPAVRQ